jgi:outer membrane lipase/esterase
MKKIMFISILLSSLLGMSTVQAFDQMIVFGDSLSDQGYQDNNITLPEGKSPLWTTPGGQTWAYYVAQSMGIAPPKPNNVNPLTNSSTGYVSGALTGTDYAAGGATSGGLGFDIQNVKTYNPPSMVQQVCQYTTGGRNNALFDTGTCAGHALLGNGDPNALYVIFIGANDIFSLIQKGGNTCNLLTDTQFQTSVQNVTWAIQQIRANTPGGNPHILVVGLPDISRTPSGLALFVPCGGHFGDYVKSFNNAESYAVVNLNAPNVAFIDIFALVDTVTTGIATVAKPVCVAGYCFVSNKTPACTTAVNELTPALTCTTLEPNAESYFFDDLVHPTDKAHQFFAGFFYQQLKAVGWI